MISQALLLFVLPALLIAAAGWDLTTYTIPNFLQLGLIASFVIFVLVIGMSPSMFGEHLLAGFIGLVIGMTFFALGYIGGGDAKLFACIALWLGFQDFLSYALTASVLGGALTLGILAMREWPLPGVLARQSWVLRLHEHKGDIPYGVALSAGAFVILAQTEIFRAGITG